MSFLKLTDQNVNGKTVLIRADLNVPFKDGKISDDTRIRASLPSIQYCLDNSAAVIVMTHLGRPTEGEFHPEDDVAPVAARLGKLLGKEVKVLNDWRDNPPSVKAGEVALLQNVRVNKGEKKKRPRTGQSLRRLVRYFCERCVWHRAPRPSLHRSRCRRRAACLRGYFDGSGIGRAGQSPENPPARWWRLWQAAKCPPSSPF